MKNQTSDCAKFPKGANVYPSKESCSLCFKTFVGNSKINECKCGKGPFHTSCLKSHLLSCSSGTQDQTLSDSDSELDESVACPANFVGLPIQNLNENNFSSSSSMPSADFANFADSFHFTYNKTPRNSAFSVKEFQTEMLERTIVMLKEQLVSKENELKTEKFRTETLETRIKLLDSQLSSMISVQTSDLLSETTASSIPTPASIPEESNSG